MDRVDISLKLQDLYDKSENMSKNEIIAVLGDLIEEVENSIAEEVQKGKEAILNDLVQRMINDYRW